MLGWPVVDPHGDPIPTAEGHLPRLESVELLHAPADVPLVVTRVTDQDPEFLRFVEQRDLVPGRPVTIIGRDATGGTVQLRGEDQTEATIGQRAASKILVRPS
jgi:DtxR family Mn-dependent transcriptional regulator